MKGIDLAKWNTVTDYNAVRQAGVAFAVLKVINASNNPDGLLYTHKQGCFDAGIPCTMGYTYSYANTATKATKAANAFTKYAKEIGINYMWLDLEDACMQGLAGKIVDIINVYKAIAQNNGMDIGIYTYSNFYTKYIKPYLNKLDNIKFWIARYPSSKVMDITDSVPSTDNLPTGISISGWQYTNKGKINGINGYVDLDEWYDKSISTDITVITADKNPFTEPISDCKVGTLGNDANWCLWYAWRCGYLLTNGQPDSLLINGVYSRDTEQIFKQIQTILGLKSDGIVGKQTRAVLKKIA
jgi:GH25 family lysozyme M1 (1,4-beta-N-acetylmuramidase)